MMRYRLVLFGLNAVLLTGIGWTLIRSLPAAAPSGAGNRQPSIGSVSPLPAITVVPSSLDRPLFRSVHSSNASPASSAIGGQPELRLVGALLGEHRIGFVEQAGAKLRRVMEGDEIEGWTVQTIDVRSVKLTRNNRVITYRLDPTATTESP